MLPVGRSRSPRIARSAAQPVAELTERALKLPSGDFPMDEIFAVEAQAPALRIGLVRAVALGLLGAGVAVAFSGATRVGMALFLSGGLALPWAWGAARYSLVLRTRNGWVRALQTEDYQLVISLAGQLQGAISDRRGRR